MLCRSILAGQFRLFIRSAAYVLIYALQNEVLHTTEFCKAIMKTIQLKLMKVAANVKTLKTGVLVELPAKFYAKWTSQKSYWLFQELRVLC